MTLDQRVIALEPLLIEIHQLVFKIDKFRMQFLQLIRNHRDIQFDLL